MSIPTFEMIAIDHLATVCGGTQQPPATQPLPSEPVPGIGGCGDGQCSPGDVQCLIGNVLDGANQRVAEARQRGRDLLDRVGPMNTTDQGAVSM
jgi:hypothetical protein